MIEFRNVAGVDHARVPVCHALLDYQRAFIALPSGRSVTSDELTTMLRALRRDLMIGVVFPQKVFHRRVLLAHDGFHITFDVELVLDTDDEQAGHGSLFAAPEDPEEVRVVYLPSVLAVGREASYGVMGPFRARESPDDVVDSWNNSNEILFEHLLNAWTLEFEGDEARFRWDTSGGEVRITLRDGPAEVEAPFEIFTSESPPRLLPRVAQAPVYRVVDLRTAEPFRRERRVWLERLEEDYQPTPWELTIWAHPEMVSHCEAALGVEDGVVGGTVEQWLGCARNFARETWYVRSPWLIRLGEHGLPIYSDWSTRYCDGWPDCDHWTDSTAGPPVRSVQRLVPIPGCVP
ncbi:MAG: hypothetical protein EA398_15260 [Deltaproteobacteria bacterium]|nr:MAG: hypothetical protein EA398_15260 [Deltaproteobacteria bacterium]